MAEPDEKTVAERTAFRDELFASGLLLDGGVDGLYQRSGAFERIVRGVEARASREGGTEGGPQFYFPPIMARDRFERTDYPRSFPDLLGAIKVFHGGDREHAELLAVLDDGGDWAGKLDLAEVVLSSAACHAIYPSLPKDIPAGGLHYEVQGYCFRHEPSIDPVRMQSFRMHEFVFIGTPDAAVAHRELWLARATRLLADLGLDVEIEEANDPFFGRPGRMLAANQREAALKFEITTPVSSSGVRTAIASANYHETHFGDAFDLHTEDGAVAHSACGAFGLERISLALVRRHGTDPEAWPESVRNQLWP